MILLIIVSSVISVIALLSMIFGEAIQDLSERLPGHGESIISLTIILSSLFTAWFINHRLPKIRVFGTLLASTGCLAMACWFFLFIINTGFLSNPKPYDTPLDAFKPTLLWLQCTFALIAGIGLLCIAFKQSRSCTPLPLNNTNDDVKYGLVARVLHWTTAFLFILMIPLGIFSTMIPEGTPYRIEYYVVHKTIGVLIFILVIIRLAWKLYSHQPKPAPGLSTFERFLSTAVHAVLYFLLLAIPISGFIMTSYFGAPTYLFGWELQPLWQSSERGVVIWGVIHKYLLPYLIYLVLGAHILGALKHFLFDKHTKVLNKILG
ncbi:cytochrome b [Pseudoalteromonas luteoviolacea]|uniref:cytochrome b n=1 Tax=Pseudoalteromonas luteoviolacea TaxID=43657 RepID=UPI0006918B75|nr:cytochrome b [Pseudoalteromonas luteoviolacea]